jgi:hypothetical protein
LLDRMAKGSVAAYSCEPLVRSHDQR